MGNPYAQQTPSNQFGVIQPQLDLGINESLMAPQQPTSTKVRVPTQGGSDWSWWDKYDAKTGQTTTGAAGATIGAAGAISNAYLGYQGLKEARRNRQMQEQYAAANLFNSAQGYNANVADVGSNNAAINNWSNEREQQYVQSNQARGTVG